MKTGIELIAAERERQITAEGWSAAHDDEHPFGQLADAAACYAVVASAQSRGSTVEEWEENMFDGLNDSLLEWPFESEAWKPKGQVRNLVKAGALIAAEIDRVLRKAALESDPETAQTCEILEIARLRSDQNADEGAPICDFCNTPMTPAKDSVGKKYYFCPSSHLHKTAWEGPI